MKVQKKAVIEMMMCIFGDRGYSNSSNDGEEHHISSEDTVPVKYDRSRLFSDLICRCFPELF